MRHLQKKRSDDADRAEVIVQAEAFACFVYLRLCTNVLGALQARGPLRFRAIRA